MVRPRHLLRLLGIYRVLVKHDLEEIALATHMLGPLRYLGYLSPSTWSWAKRTSRPLGERIRMALEDLGPIFVKFGQALSTRPDILPSDIAHELARLQDRVPPFDGSEARRIVEAAYGDSTSKVFSHFDEQPLASASIAQVHSATLHDGRDVVVKVLRPQVHKTIERDLEVLHVIARLAEKYWSASRRLRPAEVVDEYDKTINDELDLLREAANAAQLRRNFPDGKVLYVPEVHWDYCRKDVMVMERISGVPVSDIEQLRANNVDFSLLAERGVEIFFTQVFVHNFFHADMHPGNIFVDVSNPADPRYISVDFGIVGTLTPRDQHYLAGNLLAFFKRDYHRVAALHIESGWVPETTRVDEFEAAIRTVSEPIFNKPLAEISFGHFLVRLFQVARRFDMPVQPQLVLLQKTLLNIEGLGRQLYPELDLWETAKPFLENWMAGQASGREVFNRLREHWPELGESLQQVPVWAVNTLQQAAEGRLKVQVETPGLDDIRREIGEAGRQRNLHIAGGSLVGGGALLLGLAVGPAWFGWLTLLTGPALWLYAFMTRP
ncbi:MAG: ubiquinone biosynthesis regulatory protein kinase UbiB [Gammaproteobacteria bacterium]|nr:ubiquinone biosynthesis regulatory protein kinase UbiB [Gammaproteobacteria bacterium]NNF60179.1 ubiquinone biosynthesis regulatory protein kinase UbiB [Gammaproteobacteria bacterium]NNM21592.1 ubiquinone biosynthesis regulatory protein kinase UbiB [Gammaproteobacteria bacterium]